VELDLVEELRAVAADEILRDVTGARIDLEAVAERVREALAAA